MRLLAYKDNKISLTDDLVKDPPQYAILSHIWGPDGEEVTFRDLIDGTGENKPGYQKIKFCAEQAKRDGLEYCWVDTCCIDKSSSSELSTAINCMFHWYQKAARCYVYLSDVSTTTYENNEQFELAWKQAFRDSKWFTRGWTLQELIAPASVEFFTKEGRRLGDKKSLEQQIHEITGIALLALQGTPLSQFGVEERLKWAEIRQTTREEDSVYCLLGLFGVFLDPRYGQGREKETYRLRTKIGKSLRRGDVSGRQSDAIKFVQELDSLPLDEAFKEIQHLLDKAKAQSQGCTLKVQSSKEKSRANDSLISDTKSESLSFLRRLLWYIGSPQFILKLLESWLDSKLAVLQGVIASDKDITSNLQREEECARKILDELKTAQDFIQNYKVSIHENNTQSSTSEGIFILDATGHTKVAGEERKEEKQRTLAEEAEVIQRQDEEYLKLKEQVPKLSVECEQLRLNLERLSKQLEAQRVQLEDNTAKLEAQRVQLEYNTAKREAKREEAERMRREYEGKTVWQKIRAWIRWLLSCGAGY